MTDSVESACETVWPTRDPRPIEATPGHLAVHDTCGLCYDDGDGPEPGDIVLHVANGTIHKPADDDVQPRNVVDADGRQA